MNTNRTAIRRVGIAAVALVALAACGSDDDEGTATTAAGAGPATSAAPTTAAAAETTAATETTAASDGGLYGSDQTTGGSETTAASETTTGGSGAASGEAVVGTAETDLGTILVDANGRTLYAFTPDSAGEPTCVDACADAWPPAIIEGDLAVGDLDASVFSLVEHPAGGQQLKAGDWPLYLFAGDAAPGDVNGHGSGGVWFAVTPDGTPVQS